MKLSLPKLHKKKIPRSKSNADVRILRVVGFGSLFLLLAAILGTGYFLYRNVYMTIDSLESVDVTDRSVGVEVIDFRKLDQVEQAWTQKHTSATEEMVMRNPFTLGTTTSIRIATSTIDTASTTITSSTTPATTTSPEPPTPTTTPNPTTPSISF